MPQNLTDVGRKQNYQIHESILINKNLFRTMRNNALYELNEIWMRMRLSSIVKKYYILYRDN